MNERSRSKAAPQTTLAKAPAPSVAPDYRRVFSTPRAAEFLDRSALQAQTGQPAARFGGVVVKELVDNALDAAESAGVNPVIEIGVVYDNDVQRVTVADNGSGLAAGVIDAILDFDVLVSDKAVYRSPTRGLQGNAFKAVLGIPYALGVAEPIVVDACGVRHVLGVAVDPGGSVVMRHEKTASSRTAGTAVTVPLPRDPAATEGLRVDRWARSFAVVNPHATISHLGDNDEPDSAETYKPTVGEGWRKPVPTDPTSPHWYDESALARLVFAHVRDARTGGPDLPLGEFVRSFDGLKSTGKAKTVKAAVPGIEHLSDFEANPDKVRLLLAALTGHAKAPKPTRLGQVGADHMRACLQSWYGVRRFWYKQKRLTHAGVPWVLEVAVAETEEPGDVFYGVNYSASFGDPLARTMLAAGDLAATGAASLLQQADAFPTASNEYRRAAVVHVICPAVEFLDKGKTGLEVPR